MTDDSPDRLLKSFEQRDYDGVDVEEMHSVVYREKTEPREGGQPIPMALILMSFALLMFGGWYLGSHAANFEVDRFEGPAAFEIGVVDPSDRPKPVIDPMLMGKRIFNNCAACHQSTGKGIAGQYPPLDGSDIVNGRADNLARIVLHGLAGPIEVHGKTYNGKMPPWSLFDDRSLAAVLTYIRASWGNDSNPVSEDLVAEVRKATTSRTIEWTASELDSAPLIEVKPVEEPPVEEPPVEEPPVEDSQGNAESRHGAFPR